MNIDRRSFRAPLDKAAPTEIYFRKIVTAPITNLQQHFGGVAYKHVAIPNVPHEHGVGRMPGLGTDFVGGRSRHRGAGGEDSAEAVSGIGVGIEADSGDAVLDDNRYSFPREPLIGDVPVVTSRTKDQTFDDV